MRATVHMAPLVSQRVTKMGFDLAFWRRIELKAKVGICGCVFMFFVLLAMLPTGCNKLTDQTLFFLRRIANVTLIDLRGCKQITRKACEHFISDLSINSLYCLSDEKLIQKIS